MNCFPSLPSDGATSVSQIAVSTASTWQKKGRMSPNRWLRQFERQSLGEAVRLAAGPKPRSLGRRS